MTDKADVMRALAQNLPAGDPERRFLEWLADNKHDLQAAMVARGLSLPEEGPGFLLRVREAVLPTFYDAEGVEP